MHQRKLKKHLQKWLILMYAQLALIEGNRRLKAGHQGIKKEHNKGCSIIMYNVPEQETKDIEDRIHINYNLFMTL